MTCWQTTGRAALALPLLLFGVAAPARATILYDITVNTSAFAGSQGYIDLQFNPTGGTGTLSATVQTLASNDATLGSVVSSTGNVTGSGLPLTFTADNTNGPQSNDALLNVTYGNTLALSLDITTADANSTASFFLTLYDQNGYPLSPISYDPNNPTAPGTNMAVVELDLVANPFGSSPTVGPLLLGAGADAQPGVMASPEPPLHWSCWGRPWAVWQVTASANDGLYGHKSNGDVFADFAGYGFYRYTTGLGFRLATRRAAAF